MNVNNLAKVVIFIILFVFVINTAYAQKVSKTGTTVANFLEIGVGAPAVGMGGAFVSLADDATALFWNPAGTARLEQYEAVILHIDWIAETNFDFAGLVLPLGSFGTLGFSFTSLSMDDMKVRSVEKPEGTGEFFSAADIAVGITYSRKLSDRFSIGFTAKYVQQKIWHMSASAFALDAGTIFKTDLLGGMTIGASISNFGTPMKLEGRDSRYFIRIDQTITGSNERIPTNIELDEWELPLIFQIGVSTNAIETEDFRLTLAADALHPNNDHQSMNVGTEIAINEYLFIRGGYQSLFIEDSEGGLSFGVGVNSKMLFSESMVRFDYAYRDFGRLQNIHVFSLGLKF